MMRRIPLLRLGTALAAAALLPPANAREAAVAAATPPAEAAVAPVAKSAPRLDLKLFAQLERTRAAQISPDGKHLASLTGVGGRPGLKIQPLPLDSGKTIIYPPVDERYDYRWLGWASDTQVLVGEITTLDRGFQGRFVWEKGNETRLLSAAADGSSMINAVRPIKVEQTGSRIARESANVTAPIQDAVIDWLPEDPGHILLSIWDDVTSARGAAVRRIDVATGDYTYLKGPTRDIDSWRTDQSGALRLGYGYSRGAAVNRWLLYRDPANGRWRQIDQSPLLGGDYLLWGFTADPRYAYVLGPGADRRRALLRWDMSTDRAVETIYSDPRFDVEELIAAPHGRNFIGVRLHEDHTVYLDPDWKRHMAAIHAALPGMHVDLTSATRDGTQSIVLAAGPTEPGVYYLFDAARHRLTPVAYVRSGIEPEQMAPVRYVEYLARDGLHIHANLTLPLGARAQDLPTVVLPHGGPRAHDALVFDWLAQFLANRGYAVLQPNFRGSTGYGLAFERAGDRQWGRAMQDDLSDGVQWLIQQGIADRQRIAIVGGSYGGYAALMGAVQTPALYRCAVSLNGISDLVALLTKDTGGYKDEAVARSIGDPSADAAMLEAVSPLRQVAKFGIPVLLLHARDDARVDFAQSQRLYDALKAAGKAVDFIPIERGQHFLIDEAARTTFLAALEDFLAKHLQPR